MVSAMDASILFTGYGWFILAVMLAIIVPEITHQHLNYGNFPLEVRKLSRWGILFLGLGKLIKEIFGGEL